MWCGARWYCAPRKLWRLDPEDTLTLNHWRTGYLVTYALCEALALFGLIERFLGSNLQQCVPYYIGGFVLLFFFRPRQPASLPTT